MDIIICIHQRKVRTWYSVDLIRPKCSIIRIYILKNMYNYMHIHKSFLLIYVLHIIYLRVRFLSMAEILGDNSFCHIIIKLSSHLFFCPCLFHNQVAFNWSYHLQKQFNHWLFFTKYSFRVQHLQFSQIQLFFLYIYIFRIYYLEILGTSGQQLWLCISMNLNYQGRAEEGQAGCT